LLGGISILLFLLLLAVVLDVVFTLVVLFVERDDPSRVLHWLMILIFLPLVGVILFTFFHQDYRRKLRKFYQKGRAELKDLLPESSNAARVSRAITTRFGSAAILEYGELARLVNRADPYAILAGSNRVQLYVDGNEKFKALLEDLRTAKDHIHLEYYILRDDSLAREIIGILTERARAGVEVRLLLDALGGRAMRKLEPLLAGSGVKLAYFFPSLSRFNYRNHRKIAVIDGRIGYCGGYNIGEEYLGRGPLGNWRDSAVRIMGPGVDQLQIRFLQDWLFASREEVTTPSQYLRAVPEESSAMLQQVSSGLDTTQEWVKQSYIKMISMARESCYIQTPYFIPDPSVKDALRVAAASGVDVRVMIPCKPDHPFVFWASQSFCADLLGAGVRSFKYNKGFLHAKTFVVDGKVGSVGSANIDPRSFRLNFETNVIVFDAAFCAQMRDAFLADQAVCTELTSEAYAKRRWVVRFKEPFCRLLYPIT
jgi:cardiolipin synthase